MDVFARLKRLKNEDFIWIIYFFIAAFAIFSNKLEREYVLNNSNVAYKKSKTINIILFLVAFFSGFFYLFIFCFTFYPRLKQYGKKF